MEIRRKKTGTVMGMEALERSISGEMEYLVFTSLKETGMVQICLE